MAIREYRPTTNGLRGYSVNTHEEVTKLRPERSLTETLKKSGGRNSFGHTTSRFRGGGAKKIYRKVDFKRRKDGVPARVAAIEYDPNRSCHIALLFYADGEKRYILAPQGLEVDAVVLSGDKVEPDVGNCMKLESIPLGTQIHNIELRPGQGGKLARSAGMVARLSNREGDYAAILLPSGELRRIHISCRATVGAVGNPDHQLVKIGKAGRNRHRGRRPHVRGKAMNPVAHPLGGGEARSNGGRHPCSPTGVLAKGGKTRKRSKSSSKFILQGRKRGKHQF